MLFNSNVKLLVVLVLAIVLIYMLNKQDVVSNEGELEMLSEDQVTDLPVENENVVDTSVVDQVLDQTSTNVEKNEGNNVAGELQNEDSMIDSVLNTQIQGNDLGQSNVANINDGATSVTAQNMQKLAIENENNKLKFKSSELLPTEVNKDWFETDFSHAQVNVNNDNLVVTDKYVIGVNTVGQSLKNPSYDLRAAPPCPKFTVSPWMQSTIEPDFNIKNIME
jgi:hypothetical protein